MYTRLSQIFDSEPLSVAIEAFRHWPNVVLYELRRTVFSHVFGADRTDMVPTLEELAEAACPPPAGIFSVGEWAHQRRKPRESIRQTFWAVIDWDVVFKSGPDFLVNVSSMGPLALLWWGIYSNYVRRRALMPSELLTRQMMQAFGTAYDTPSFDPIRYPPLTKREMDSLQAFNNYVLNDGYILYALQGTLRKNFQEYFQAATVLGEKTRTLLRKIYPDTEYATPLHKRLSAFALTRVANINRVKSLKYEDMDLTPEMEDRGYTNLPDPRNERFYELSYIYSCTNAKDHGVHFYTYRPNPVQKIPYAIVHMGKYAALRTKAGCQTFLQYLKDAKMEGTSLESCGRLFADWFRFHYSALDYSVEYSKFMGLAHTYFGPNTKAEELWIVPMKEVRKHMRRAHKIRLKLDARVRGEGPLPGDPEKKRRSGRRPFVAESPEFEITGGRKTVVRVLPWHGNVYFSPMDWEIPKQDTQRIDKRGVVVPKKGVYQHPELEHEYYTVEFLRSVHFGGNFDYNVVYQWLEDFKNLNKRELGVYRQSSLFLERRHQPSRAVRRTTTQPYHQSEDSIIIKYYRPKMNADHRRWIMEGCPGRSWAAIRRRAGQLCDQLIEDGITDRSELPHLRISSSMLKKLRTASAVKARDARREKKEKNHEPDIETNSSAS